MKIRLSTYNTPLFREGGFQLTEGWKEYDLNELTPEQKDLLEAYTGKIIQVAPDQIDELGNALGLELFEGRFRYGSNASTKPELGTRHRIESGEMKPASPEPAPARPAATGAPVSGPIPEPSLLTPSNDGRSVQPQPVSQVPTHIVDPGHTPVKKTVR